MKKNNLLKVVIISFLLIVLLSCFIKPSVIDGARIVEESVTSIGLTGIFKVIYSAITQNLDILVFVVMVGMMYGVLNKTDAYQNLVSNISGKFNGKEKWLVVISVIFFALMSSLFGISLELFVFVPFVIAILMHSGYDKVTSFASTIGAILIGLLGATFNTTVLSTINTYFEIPYTHLILVKAFILLISLYLLLSHILKKSLVDNSLEYLDIPNYEVSSKKRNTLPVILYLFVILLLVVIGVFKFGDIVGIKVFATIKEGLYTIPFIKNILGDVSIFSTFGYIDLAYILFVSSLVIGFIYKVKFDDMVDGMYKGAKRVLPAGIMLLFVASIPVICTDYSFYLTIVGKLLSLFDSFNIFISTGVTVVTSVFVPNISMGAAKLLPAINATLSGDVNVLALIIQTIYGVVMLISPTSALLVFGLSYCKLSYSEWIKYILKVFLYILIVLVAIFIIIVLI